MLEGFALFDLIIVYNKHLNNDLCITGINLNCGVQGNKVFY